MSEYVACGCLAPWRTEGFVCCKLGAAVIHGFGGHFLFWQLNLGGKLTYHHEVVATEKAHRASEPGAGDSTPCMRFHCPNNVTHTHTHTETHSVLMSVRRNLLLLPQDRQSTQRSVLEILGEMAAVTHC